MFQTFFQVEASLAPTTTLDPDTPFTRELMESLSMRTQTKVSDNYPTDKNGAYIANLNMYFRV